MSKNATGRPTAAGNDRDELRKKIRRVFVSRTHKFPHKKIEIMQPPETLNQRFILAPYEATVEKLVALVTTAASPDHKPSCACQNATEVREQLLTEIKEQIPPKSAAIRKLYKTDKEYYANLGYNAALTEVTALLKGYREEA